MLRVAMEERVDELACPGCDRPFRRVYGVLTEDGEPAGACSIDLHYGRAGRYAYLGMEAPDEKGRPYGVVCRLLKDTFFHFSDHICESDLRVRALPRT